MKEENEQTFLNDYIIRLADITQMKAIFDFQSQHHLNTSPNQNIYDSQVKDIPTDFEKLLNIDLFMKGKFWIVTTREDRNKIIGSIGLYLDKEILVNYNKEKEIRENSEDNILSAELNTFAVCPSQRGKGIGSELIRFCLKKAKDQNVKRVHLVTVDFMKTAVSLYTKFGFRIYKENHFKIENADSFLIDNKDDYNNYNGDKYITQYYELNLKNENNFICKENLIYCS